MSRIAFIGSLFLFAGHFAFAQITFIIESLPDATPATDTIFICGNFNNWIPNDPAYAVHRQPNGQLAVTVNATTLPLEYKFTRGSWTKVETSVENHYIDNRISLLQKSPNVFVRIDNWLDLGGARQLNYIIFYFFACAFQSIALCLLVYRIRKKDDGKIVSFLIVNAVFTSLLILLVTHEIVNPIGQSYLTFVFQVSLFLWGPLLLYFIHSFYIGRPLQKLYFYFVPAGAALLFIAFRILDIHALNFLSPVTSRSLVWVNTFLMAGGFIFNVVVYGKMWHQYPFLKRYRRLEQDTKINFLFYSYWTSCAALLLIPINALLIILGIKNSFVEDYHAVAVVLSTLIFIETFFLWRYPEIFKEEKTHALPFEDTQYWVEKLNAFMKDAKPYKKADLSVSDLAEMLGTKPHILSKVINDSYHKNFRDFVNCYRIQEFIGLANTKQFKHYTYLALAEEVGFNSKSTFNLAFKKQTSQSPRAYFKNKEFS
jgi:AraC-like DNA-binding protein